jgi:uncharacterized membrane protein
VRDRAYHRHPLPPTLVVGLALAVAGLGVLFLLSALEYAYRRIGVPEGALFALMVSSLLGGAVNIPVARWETRPVVVEAEILIFGIRYRMPLVRRATSTILAVNLGGAVIPAALSLYLLIANGIWWPALAATAIVTLVVHRVARPVPGLGIAIPAILPPILSASAAIVLTSNRTAAVAYVAGTLGTLIGADLLNLRQVRAMAPAIASIGGAGTFDGVFLSGLAAVLLVGVL